MASTPVNIRVPDDLAEWVTSRQTAFHEPSSVGVGLKAEATMLRDILAAELRRIRLTLEELHVIASVVGATAIDRAIAGSTGLIEGELRDARSFGQDIAEDLIDKVAMLGPAGDHALHCAVIQWWTAGGDHSIEGWAQVGVRVVRH